MAAQKAMPAQPGNTPKKSISPSELSQRVAVVKRFKELLKAQRDRFRAYLDALDRDKDVILGGTADDLIRHVELEENIVADIFSIQKVIDPLEKMYHSIKPEFSPSNNSTEEVSGLKEALEGLKAEAVVRSEQNRALLSKRMAELRSEIKSLQSNSYARRQSVFGNAAAASRIDIKG